MPVVQVRQRFVLCVAAFAVVLSLCVLYLPCLLSWTAGSTDSKLSPQRHNHIHGARHSDIEQAKCSLYSPAHPSAGGPGCSPKCTGERNSSYAAGFHNATHQWPKDLISNMHLAASVLKKYGTPSSLDTERAIYLHVSFDYYCCYSPEEGVKIGEFLRRYRWTPHELWFGEMVCAIHGHGGMVSIVLMANEDSQEKLLQWAEASERDLEATGVRKHIPRRQLQGFHMTLATVNQSVFPVQPAVKEINRVIPPGTWHSTPVLLHTPVCNKCERLIREGIH